MTSDRPVPLPEGLKTPKPHPLLRRGFLLTIGAGAALVLGGAGANKLFLGQNHLIAELVKKQLHYLALDAEGLRRFAEDYALEAKIQYGALDRAANALYLYTPFGRSVPGVAAASAQAATRFLMSSDFFYNGADESRVVQYLGLYSPFTSPCGNPFANLAL